jgi:uncharacterized membrane protein
MITILVSLLIGFAGGFYAGIKNASSAKVGKALDILAALKGKSK